MKKATFFTALLAIAAFLATTAFKPAIVIDNGVVYGYVAGKTLSIRNANTQDDFMLKSNTLVLPESLANGLAAGSRVTVFGQCFSTPALKASASNNTNTNPRFQMNNDKACYALAIVVRANVAGNAGATGGSGSSTSPTPTPTVKVTPTP